MKKYLIKGKIKHKKSLNNNIYKNRNSSIIKVLNIRFVEATTWRKRHRKKFRKLKEL